MKRSVKPRKPRRPRTRRNAIQGTLAAALVLACAHACASVPNAAPAGAEPAPDRHAETPTYPGQCSLVNLEVMNQPAPGRGASPGDLGTGTVELVATYRPGRDPNWGAPVELSYRVRQESADDLQAHLERYHHVVCGQESTAGNGERSQPEVPPFQDDQGNPVAPVRVEARD